MSAQQASQPCHPRGLGLVQVPWAAPVTLCISVPGEAGQVDLLPLLLPLGIVPVHLQGLPHWVVGSWVWDQAWTWGFLSSLPGEDTQHQRVEAEKARSLEIQSLPIPSSLKAFDIPIYKLD